jgi:outer membrane immunogenic protein
MPEIRNVPVIGPIYWQAASERHGSLVKQESAMRRLMIASTSAIALLALSGAGQAADILPTKAPPMMVPAVAPGFSWTGLYVGVNGGGAWGRSYWDSAGAFDLSGGLVGGTLGYNYQIGSAVLGIEGDGDWTDISGSGANAGCPLGCTTSNSWLATVRGRLGYAADRFLPYITGGAAFGNIKASTPGFPGGSATNAGWTAGAGIEYAISRNWSLKAEYLYVDLGHFDCGLSCSLIAPDHVSFNANIVRGGINFRF